MDQSVLHDTLKKMPTEHILDLKQIAELLRCSEEQAASQLASGNLPGVKFGKAWIAPADALLSRLNEIAIAQANERRSRERATPMATTVDLPKSARKRPPALPSF
ncbi:MAG: hypothetical protein H6942_08265 [Candidatus Accumulibacter sp.]|uniref:hypothetical protein n=1 Tax=Accumulibacter sp. TaxID=2053492 RepID=UPI0025F62D58|nr:hypothetical protein [Accumulibacter sp.]MCP5248506.1 hypothetical protein [Accumulibacter sp.]